MHGSSMKNRRQLSKGVGIAVLCYLIILSQSYMIMITCFQKVTMTKIKQQKIHLVTLFTNKQFFVQFPSNYSKVSCILLWTSYFGRFGSLFRWSIFECLHFLAFSVKRKNHWLLPGSNPGRQVYRPPC